MSTSNVKPPDAGKMEAGRMDAGRMEAGHMEAGKMGAGKMGAGKMGAGKMGAGKMGAGKMDAGHMEAGPPNVKKRLFAQLAIVGGAFSSPNRLELLEFLAQGERHVEALAAGAGLSVANTSQHLQRLKQAGLVASRKQGQHVYYSLADGTVIDIMAAMRRLAQTNLAEVERLIARYLTSKDGLEAVRAEELMARMKSGSVTVIDVRPPEEFSAGHLPGAINIPLNEIEKRIGGLPAGGEVVAYCRGPYCVLAFEAVAKLREKGVRARRFEAGFPEWKRAGLPVEKTPPS